MKARIISPQPLRKKSRFNKTDFYDCKKLSMSNNIYVLFDGKHNDGKMFFEHELEIIV